MTKNILLLAVVASLALGGCYQPKFIDSYNSTMSKTEAPKGHGDPASYGGIAEATGGTVNKASYATSSKGADPLQATQEGKDYRFAEPKDDDSLTATFHGGSPMPTSTPKQTTAPTPATGTKTPAATSAPTSKDAKKPAAGVGVGNG